MARLALRLGCHIAISCDILLLLIYGKDLNILVDPYVRAGSCNGRAHQQMVAPKAPYGLPVSGSIFELLAQAPQTHGKRKAVMRTDRVNPSNWIKLIQRIFLMRWRETWHVARRDYLFPKGMFLSGSLDTKFPHSVSYGTASWEHYVQDVHAEVCDNCIEEGTRRCQWVKRLISKYDTGYTRQDFADRPEEG
ncbi:hypothetical protein EDB83DRAFT_2313551 [Lactarius deliciosus]|nr:hypothetical protein EDB83DRAFT_2313551 [Lactarius deliciosus]